MPTRILDLPLVQMDLLTGTHEDMRPPAIYFTEANEISPIPLTGIDFRMQARSARPDAQAWVDATLGNGMIVVDAVGGVLGIAVPHTVMRKVKPGRYVYDILATGDDIPRVIVQGEIEVMQGITRPPE